MKLAALRDLTVAFATSLLAFGLAFAPAAAAQVGAPALWKIAGPTGNVYLFGSIHMLPPDVNWRTPALERALNEAQVVVFETEDVELRDVQLMQALIARYGVLPPGQTLRGVLPEATYLEFERMATALGLPAAGLAQLRPWLVAVTLSMQSAAAQGLDPKRGVDYQAATWARGNGKALAALETNESQVRIFADLTPEEERQFLAVTLRQLRETPQLLGDLLAAYRSGDVAVIEKVLNLGFDEFPSLRQRVLNDRHQHWLPQIERMIADGRSHVVIVGAVHLIGPDSVVAMLRAKGVKVEGP
jgi:uncharacterized protein YbaP (TraB family)